jgi:putative transposase
MRVCTAAGIVQSMGCTGSALDNAAAEAVTSTVKVELVHRTTFTTRVQGCLIVGGWISSFYDSRHRHSDCGGLPLIAYEHLIMNTADQEDQAA